MSESQKSGDIPLAEEVPVSQLKLVDSVKATIPAATPVAPHEPAAQLASSQPPASISTEGDAVKILVAFYSMYGHVERLAQAIVEGVNGSLVKVECKVRIIPETLSEEARKKMHAAPSSTFPTVTPEDLVQADGIIFGFPTRFGMPCAQAKSFLDSLGSVWESGASIGKTAGVFVSTGTLGGGQETTAWTSIAAFSHLGMAYVPMGYSHEYQQELRKVRASSPYGPGTLAGPEGDRVPSRSELEMCKHYGGLFTRFTSQLVSGRRILLAEKPVEKIAEKKKKKSGFCVLT